MKQMRIISVILGVFLLYGCMFSNNNNINTEKEQRLLAEKIFLCLDEDDTDSLKKLFCQKTLDEYEDIDKEIFRAMIFYDGKTVSYDSKSISNSDGGSYKDGNLVKLRTSGYIENIETSSGAKYTVRFYNYLISEENPEKVGISKIVIISDDGEECSIGELVR